MKLPPENNQIPSGCSPPPACSALSPNESRYIEGYAAALQDIIMSLTGENGCAKSYDPMTVESSGEVMHSYAFYMCDGGRHHMVSDYVDIADIKETLLRESETWIRDDFKPNAEVSRGDGIASLNPNKTS
jgi:hypothetical protein